MTTTTPKSSDVRQWARTKGWEVGERGRLSPDVLAAYAAAHGGPPVKAAAKKAPAKKAAKKAPAKRAAARKAPARKAATKAPAKRALATKPAAVATPPVARETPSFRQPERVTSAPAVTMDSARVAALEEQIAKLSARLERIEAARAASSKRGFFSRK